MPAVACFDTTFHATLPPAAATYAVPRGWRDEWGLRRYGFHGLSHAYASRRAAELLDLPLGDLRTVVCHLGAGASLCAVQGGRSVDTTMGFTPLDGLVMATRAGSIDPGAVLWLVEHGGLSPAEVAHALEHESGLLGLAGSGDMRDVLERAGAGDPEAILARDVYLHHLRAGIAAMAAALGGLDVLVFTGGVGERAPFVRAAAAEGLGFLGVAVEPDANARPGERCGRLAGGRAGSDARHSRARRPGNGTAGRERARLSRFSDELSRWLDAEGDKTLGSIIETFEQKSFAVLFVLLLGPSALPVPTGGATQVLEVIAMLLALQLLVGREKVWLPRRWRAVTLAGPTRERFLERLLRLLRWLEASFASAGPVCVRPPGKQHGVWRARDGRDSRRVRGAAVLLARYVAGAWRRVAVARGSARRRADRGGRDRGRGGGIGPSSSALLSSPCLDCLARDRQQQVALRRASTVFVAGENRLIWVAAGSLRSNAIDPGRCVGRSVEVSRSCSRCPGASS